MRDTARPSPASRPMSLFLAVQNHTLKLLKRSCCSLLHSLAQFLLLACWFLAGPSPGGSPGTSLAVSPFRTEGNSVFARHGERPRELRTFSSKLQERKRT
jgi:hypothetical protein